MDRTVEIRFGPPGTGKTTSLLNEVDRLLEQGLHPSKIAFVSFTKKAADVVKIRAVRRFGFVEDDLPYFRTLHSAAYRELGITTTEVMDTRDYRTVAEAVGLQLTGSYDYETERVAPGGSKGDICLRLYSLARARHTTVEHEWRQAQERDIVLGTVERFVAALDAFKRDRGVIDFCDMLDECTTPLPVDVFIVDEAQDLTLAQWALARRLAVHTPSILLAGDDDQALYDWAGASSRTLRVMQGVRRVLPHSFRLPRTVKRLADQIATRIHHRVPKTFSAKEEEGSVAWIHDPAEVDLRSGESWLLLTRHRYQSGRFIKACRAQGVVYQVHGKWSNDLPYIRAALHYQRLLSGRGITYEDAKAVAQFVPNMDEPAGREEFLWDNMPWPDGFGKPDWMDGLGRLTVDEVEYVRTLRRNNESLTKPGRVVISTIHGAKGDEADHVVLGTDITKRTLDQLNTDEEQRVWYVGASRAKKDLTLMFPSSQKFWSL